MCDEHALDPGRYVIVHPGARMASRRWPVDRFALAARQLADDGWQIVLTGTRARNCWPVRSPSISRGPA